MKPNISDNEQQLIYDYVYNTKLIELLESDLLKIDKSRLKITGSYVHLLEDILRKVRLYVKDMKMEMKRLDIKVFPGKYVEDIIIQYLYTAHGYKGEMRFWDAALNNHVAEWLFKYLKTFGDTGTAIG
ncbi:hypothetical protein [Bacillus sp. REN16]|uniref:hypothetical protein n=1 Tax=Bacillus sp. REN16 TaxID=2887296 RepID=UPI001E4FE638|nr:hypothetical protein [Bacillus sp. REN16]MCC3358961.1 hypothetical protein [Bacillus sp. REN16]